MPDIKLQPGTAFIYKPDCFDIKKGTDPCYATTGVEALVYRTISLTKYPSSRDFFDPVPEIKEGAVGIILQPLGIPQSLWLEPQIINDPALREKYTVYEAVICNELVNVFRNDISVGID